MAYREDKVTLKPRDTFSLLKVLMIRAIFLMHIEIQIQ